MINPPLSICITISEDHKSTCYSLSSLTCMALSDPHQFAWQWYLSIYLTLLDPYEFTWLSLALISLHDTLCLSSICMTLWSSSVCMTLFDPHQSAWLWPSPLHTARPLLSFVRTVSSCMHYITYYLHLNARKLSNHCIKCNLHRLLEAMHVQTPLPYLP